MHRFPFLIILGNEPIAIANLHKNIGFHACSIKKVHPDLPLPNTKALLCPVSSRLQTNVLAGKQKKVCRISCTPSFVLYLSDTAMILPLVSEERIILHRLIHLLTYTFDDLLVLRVCQHLVDEVGTEQHHVFLAAAGRHCSRAEAQTACLES